ncbi:DUF4870 family protein [Alteriqipengyuania sp. 357]
MAEDYQRGAPAAAPERATGDATPQAATPQTGGVMLQRPIIVSALYLIGLMNGVTVLIGLILAYVWRGDESTPEWEKTHFTYLIRTFWVVFWFCVLAFAGVLVAVLATAVGELSTPDVSGQAADAPAVLLAVVGAAILGMVLFVWSCIRTILSLARATSCQPMARPKTYLF